MPDEQRSTPEVAFIRALRVAQSEAPIIEAARKHYDGYRYASLVDVKKALVPILNKHGLIVELAGAELAREEELETAKGGAIFRTDMLCRFRVSHDMGHTREYVIEGRRLNDKDKGVQHAIADATRSMFLGLLATSASSEEVEEGQGGGQVRGRGGPKRQQQTATRPAPVPQGKGGAGGPGFTKAGGKWYDDADGSEAPLCTSCNNPYRGPACPRCTTTPEPPAPTQEDPTRAEKTIRELKSDYSRKVGRVEDWQETAFLRDDDQVPNDLAQWEAKHYKYAIDKFKAQGSAPVVLDTAAHSMGRKEPANAAMIANLRERAVPLGGQMMKRAETAIQCGWKHAVEEMLDVVAGAELLRDDF